MSKLEDLKGFRSGKLVALEPTDHRKNRYIIWKCQCDCGNIAYVTSRELKHNTKKNCGCEEKKTARRGPIAEDLTGRTFGELTVLERDFTRKKETAWKCICTCGNTRTVLASKLKSGRVKSCGCLAKKSGVYNAIDLKGRVFGRLTAIEKTDLRTKSGSVIWKCKCECGNDFQTSEDNLMQGNSKSCGCLRVEHGKELVNQLQLVDGTSLSFLENRKSRKDNKSGYRGIAIRNNGRYAVTIGFKKKRYYVGMFDTFDEAMIARQEAEELLHDGFVECYRTWKQLANNKPVEWIKENPFVYEVVKTDGHLDVVTNVGDLVEKESLMGK